MSAPSPPGWFPDPYGSPGLLRWWDGQQWTQARRPAAQVPAQPTQPTPAYGQQFEPGYGQQPPAGFAPPPSPTTRRNGPLPWVIGGASLAVIVVVAVVAVFVLRGNDDDGAAPAARSATPSGPAGGAPGVPGVPSASASPAATKSAVIGRISDAKLGISYARLGAPWTLATGTWLRPDYFSAGQVSVVQAPFEQYDSFNATSLSGPPRPEESVGYSDPRNLSVPGGRVTQRILREHFNLANRRTTISSGPYRVAGRQGWLERFRLDFTDAEARGWKFSADTVAVLVLDLGDRRLGLLWVSVPDTFPNQGDIDQVLGSVRVS